MRNSPVLIQGESGTGKELAARAVHRSSKRAHAEFIALNCAALPENLVESELFGYERGAFTGAIAPRKGYFEQADKKTLFLDEIGETTLAVQAKLLRVLQEGEIRRVGAGQAVRVDVRIIAATNLDLKSAVRQGKFREDLYFRLNVLPVRVPALRERRGDILLLARHFISSYAIENELAVPSISREAEPILEEYPWPGNVRELQHVIQQAVEAVEFDADDAIRPRHLPADVFGVNPPSGDAGIFPSMAKFLMQQKREYTERVVKRVGLHRAAEILDIHPKAIYAYLRRLDLTHLLTL